LNVTTFFEFSCTKEMIAQTSGARDGSLQDSPNGDGFGARRHCAGGARVDRTDIPDVGTDTGSKLKQNYHQAHRRH
jgi:hypothetical protein